MADAYSTIVQQSLNKKEQEIQSRSNVAQSNANMLNSVYQSVMSLADTTTKLVASAISTDISNESRILQNKYDVAEAEGVFDRVDIHDENSGVEADPDKTYQNRLTWLNETLSNSENKFRNKSVLKKSFTKYLEGKQASIIESKNTQNYNTVQNGISSSIEYMNTPYYDPDNTTNDIDYEVSTAFKDYGYNKVADLINVETYGIGDVAQNWITEKAKADNGEDNDFAKVDYELRYALGAYTAGESEYSFNQRKTANFDSDYLSYQVGQWARAEGDIIKSEYLTSGCDSTYLSKAISDLTSSVYNNGLQVDKNGKAITISRDRLGTSGLASALQIAQSYATNLCQQVANDQQNAWNSAIEKFNSEYGQYGKYFDFASEEEYINYLVEASENKLDSNFARKNISENAKSSIRINQRNAEVGELYGIIVDQESTPEDRSVAIREVFSQGLTDLFTSDSGFGLGNLYDSSDDNASASVRVALNKLKVNGMSYGNAFKELMQGSDIDAYKKVFAEQSIDSVYASETEEAYKYNTGAESFIEKSIESLSGDSSVSFDEADKETYKDLYVVKDDIDSNDLVKQYLAKDSTTEEEKKAVWNAYYYKNFSTSTTTVNAANSVIEGIETEMQNENDINTLISSIKPIVLTGSDNKEAWDYIVDNNLIEFVTGDNGLGMGDFKNGGKTNGEAAFREYISNYAEENGLSFEEAYEPAMREALESYSLSDLQTTSTTSKSGYTKVNSPVYNRQMLRAYEKTNASEGFEDALVTAIATGDESELDGLFNTYGTSWTDYVAYKSIYDTIKGDGEIQEAFKQIDSNDKLSDEEKKTAKINLAQSVFDAEVKLLTGTEAEKKEAKTALTNLKGNAYYNNAQDLIDFGFVLSNVYSDSNKDGYSDAFRETYSQSVLNDLIGKDAQETKDNVDNMINFLKSFGYDTSEFEKEWGDISYEDGYIDTMTNAQLLASFEPLQTPLEEIAVATYGSFVANYSDVTSTEYGYVGMNIEDVIKEKYNSLSDKLDDELLLGLVNNGTISYGVDYQGMKWSKDAYNRGGTDTQSWADAVALLVVAPNEQGRKKVIEDAKKVLNPEAIKELEGVNSVNLMIHTIEGYEDYNFFDTVVNAIGTDSNFYPLARKSTLSDWNDCLAESSYLNSGIAEAVRTYTDPTSFEKKLNDLAGQVANTYLLQVDSSYRTMRDNGFVTQDFDMFEEVTQTLGDDPASTANSFFDSWYTARDNINKTADTNDYNTQMLCYNFWNEGKNKSEMSKSLTAKLADPDIDEATIIPYTIALTLEQMGNNLGGITSESFDGEDKDNAKVRLYKNLQTLEKNDPEKYSLLVSSVTALDRSFSDIRDYNAKGYDNNYTYSIEGLQVDGYSRVENNNGEWIGYNDDGETNLTMYADNGSVKLKDRAPYIAGDYYRATTAFGSKILCDSDIIETKEGLNQIVSYNTSKTKAHNVTDYSAASEFVPVSSQWSGQPYRYNSCYLQETTGAKIANEYFKLSIEGKIEEATKYISTLSDGMKNFVTTSYENVLASYALAMTSEEELGKSNYLYATRVLQDRAYTPTVGLGSYNLPFYEGEFKEKCEEALENILKKQTGGSSRRNIRTSLFEGSLSNSRSTKRLTGMQ